MHFEGDYRIIPTIHCVSILIFFLQVNLNHFEARGKNEMTADVYMDVFGL